MRNDVQHSAAARDQAMARVALALSHFEGTDSGAATGASAESMSFGSLG
jgi:hypothetical protein